MTAFIQTFESPGRSSNLKLKVSGGLEIFWEKALIVENTGGVMENGPPGFLP